MSVQRLACTTCGAPLDIPANADQVTCPFCGTALTIDRGAGYATLKGAEQVSQALRDTSGQTQSAIQEGTTVTQSELKRLQLGQDLTAAQSQLHAIQAEIRSLQREKRSRVVGRQLHDLQVQEAGLHLRIQQLQQILNPSQYVSASREQKVKRGNPTQRRGCITGCVTFLIVGVLLSFIAIPLDQAIFGVVSSGDGQAGPLASIAAMIGVIAGLLAYFYITMPNAAIWRPIKQRLNKQKEPQQ